MAELDAMEATIDLDSGPNSIKHQPDFLSEISSEAYNLVLRSYLYHKKSLTFLAWLYHTPELDSMAATNSVGLRQRGGRNTQGRIAADDVDTSIFRLKDKDYEKIVDYLEIPENLQAITGGGRKTQVGKKYGSKAVVFKKMLAALQHHGFPMNIDGPNLQKRFGRYVKRYKDAREVKLDTGGGLTAEELADEVLLEDKLNKICPHFERMHALYGERPNVAPPILGDAGVDEDELILLDEHTDENNSEGVEEAEHADTTSVGMAATATELLPEANYGTPSTLKQGITMAESTFWDEMENVPGSHGSKCLCSECRIIVDLTNTDLDSSEIAPRALRPIPANTVGQQKKQTKSPQVVSKETNTSAKPSFTAIYAECLNLKADYRNSLISTRDKWKAQDLEERRVARVTALMESQKQARYVRKHQLAMEAIAAEQAMKKARVEFENALELTIKKSESDFQHQKDMAEANRRTALLTTLLASNKTPEEIKSLLPIIDGAV
jgi:hypothetical protein